VDRPCPETLQQGRFHARKTGFWPTPTRIGPPTGSRRALTKRLKAPERRNPPTGQRSGDCRNVQVEKPEVHDVDSIDHYGNTRQRVEQLISTWNQGSGGAAEFIGEPDDPLIDTSAEPRRRTRTPLTGEEVDAMRTARANGVSVNILAKQFGVHRGTVWAKTRQP